MLKLKALAYKIVPYYVPEDGTIIIRDVQTVGYHARKGGKWHDTPDKDTVIKFLEKLDKVYWEIM